MQLAAQLAWGILGTIFAAYSALWFAASTPDWLWLMSLLTDADPHELRGVLLFMAAVGASLALLFFWLMQR